jgi:hypothetical protein
MIKLTSPLLYSVHCVLWTKANTQQLIDRNIVIAELPTEEEDSHLRVLVLKYQVHKCSSYCTPDGSNICRFGYPYLPNDKTQLINNRVHYKRSGDCGFINSYNPFLLRLLESSMDIQLNNGKRALNYLAKYLTKQDLQTGVEFASSDQQKRTAKFHFENRILGAVEAVYDIYGFRKHHTSVGCIFLNTNLPHNDRRVLKKNIASLHPDSEDIFVERPIEKYLLRDRALHNLTYPQYFMFYNMCTTTEEAEQIYNQDLEMDVDMDIEEVPEVEGETLMVQERGFNGPLPIQVKDRKGRKFRLRKRFPIYRTAHLKSTNGEDYFYQQIILQLPSFDFDSLYRANNNSWRGSIRYTSDWTNPP